MHLLPKISQYLQNIEKDFELIPAERKLALLNIAEGVRKLLEEKGHADLIYVCTHNSRRSHMGQLWALAAAAYYNVSGIGSYSGGTEVTAFNPNAIKAMQDAGFEMSEGVGEVNPHYDVVYVEGGVPVTVFSKKYMDSRNPGKDFIAVMTCAHADENCPVVMGASLKVATPYEDPKEGDGKPEQEQVYRERCRQIAREVLYTFSLVRE